MQLEFDGPVWEWRGPAPYYFVTVPEEGCAEITDAASLVTYGWGMIPATVTLGGTTWTTSLWPKDDTYVVPLKAAVRWAEQVDTDDVVTLRLDIELGGAVTDIHHDLSAGVLLREAVVADVPALVALLADDDLGRTREHADGVDLAPYLDAFSAIDDDPAHLLLVACVGDTVVATLQLSFIPGLSRAGMTRAQVEAVRVHRDHRGSGLGEALLAWVVDEARRRGCGLVQLTTDKQRADAHRFYERLGFVATHEGFKLPL